MKIPTINTKRLHLRPFEVEDAKPLHGLMVHPEVLRFFPNSDPPPLEKIERLIKEQLKQWSDRGYGWWAVAEKDQEQIIGWCGLQYLPETDETEVGYLLGRDYWGRGIATEAAQASLKYGFESLDFSNIVAVIDPDNKASIRVVEKCGMRFTNAAEYFGMNMMRYELLKVEYEKST